MVTSGITSPNKPRNDENAVNSIIIDCEKNFTRSNLAEDDIISDKFEIPRTKFIDDTIYDDEKNQEIILQKGNDLQNDVLLNLEANYNIEANYNKKSTDKNVTSKSPNSPTNDIFTTAVKFKKSTNKIPDDQKINTKSNKIKPNSVNKINLSPHTKK